MIGVAKDARGNAPRALPLHALLVDEQAHELGHAERWVRVVQLDGGHGVQLVNGLLGALEAPQNVLKRRAHKEVLLFEAKLLAHLRVVVRVKHVRNILTLLLLLHRLVVVASRERVQIKLLWWSRAPQSNIQAIVSIEAGYGRVISNGLYGAVKEKKFFFKKKAIEN